MGHIDWASFTLETAEQPDNAAQLYLLARSLIKKEMAGHETQIFNGRGFDQTLSRPPYRVCVEREDHGARLFGTSHTGTLLYELSGRGCEGLHSWTSARTFTGACYHRVSRLDYAIDYATDVQPSDFANERKHRAFRTISFIRSDTGETVYIGSPHSDRFARVYRYREPHPRAHLLRVEFVFRRHLARIAAEDISNSQNQTDFEARLGNTWGWAHEIWNPGSDSTDKLKTPTLTRSQEDTIMWLYKQVAPALRRMLAEGALDMTDWLSHVYNK